MGPPDMVVEDEGATSFSSTEGVCPGLGAFLFGQTQEVEWRAGRDHHIRLPCPDDGHCLPAEHLDVRGMDECLSFVPDAGHHHPSQVGSW